MTETTLVIQGDGQPTLSLTVESAPVLVFEESGVQGPPGVAGPPGPGSADYDPGDLTLIFDNKLI